MKEMFTVHTLSGTLVYERAANSLAEVVSRGIKDGVNFSYADFSGQNLSGGRFKDGEFFGAFFRFADLEEADFSGCNLGEADLVQVSGMNANFSRASLIFARIEDAYMGGVNFRKADLNCANFTRGSLYAADFRGASIVDTQFLDTSLQEADFRGCEMDYASFDRTRMSDVKFGKNICWSSHDCIGEYLRQAATNIEQEMLAAFVAEKTEWCWNDFLEIEEPVILWAVDVLHKRTEKEGIHRVSFDNYHYWWYEELSKKWQAEKLCKKKRVLKK